MKNLVNAVFHYLRLLRAETWAGFSSGLSMRETPMSIPSPEIIEVKTHHIRHFKLLFKPLLETRLGNCSMDCEGSSFESQYR